MGNVPELKPAEAAALLGRLGFAEVRQRGSDRRFRDAAGRCSTVPFHSSRDISPTLLRQIAKDVGLTVSEFVAYRQAQPCGQPDRVRRAASGAARHRLPWCMPDPLSGLPQCRWLRAAVVRRSISRWSASAA